MYITTAVRAGFRSMSQFMIGRVNHAGDVTVR